MKVIRIANQKRKRLFVPYSKQTNRCWQVQKQPVLSIQRTQVLHKRNVCFIFGTNTISINIQLLFRWKRKQKREIYPLRNKGRTINFSGINQRR